MINVLRLSKIFKFIDFKSFLLSRLPEKILRVNSSLIGIAESLQKQQIDRHQSEQQLASQELSIPISFQVQASGSSIFESEEQSGSVQSIIKGRIMSHENQQSLSSNRVNVDEHKLNVVKAEQLKVSKNFSSGNTSSSAAATSFTSSLADILKFLELVGSLKHIKRTGWVLRNVEDCETIAGHMYRMSVMSFLIDSNDTSLNRLKCMELALVHDLAECIVGDLTPFCGVTKEDKKMRELKAMEEICKLIQPQGKKLLELFEEYEGGQSPESKFVKDLDRLDLMLQAFEYEKRDNCVLKHQEFFDSTEGKFSNPLVKQLVNEINVQREHLAANVNGDKIKDGDQSLDQQQQNGIADSTAAQQKLSSS